MKVESAADVVKGTETVVRMKARVKIKPLIPNYYIPTIT